MRASSFSLGQTRVLPFSFLIAPFERTSVQGTPSAPNVDRTVGIFGLAGMLLGRAEPLTNALPSLWPELLSSPLAHSLSPGYSMMQKREPRAYPYFERDDHVLINTNPTDLSVKLFLSSFDGATLAVTKRNVWKTSRTSPNNVPFGNFSIPAKAVPTFSCGGALYAFAKPGLSWYNRHPLHNPTGRGKPFIGC